MAAFNDYCEMSHIAKQVGGPKVYSSILVAGGMALGVAAFEGLPRFAAWATPRVECAASSIKAFIFGTSNNEVAAASSLEIEPQVSGEEGLNDGAATE